MNKSEYRIPSDGKRERFMQTYNYPDFCTVSFYRGDRIEVAVEPFFAAWAKPHPVATFYLEVPYGVVEEYLKSVGI